MEVILASASPRRRELLKHLVDDFRIVPSDAEENIAEDDPGELAKKLALLKAQTIASSFENAIVIGADTLVVADGRVMGKPANRNDATEMLKKLSDKTHQVITGVCVINTQNGRCINDFCVTDVTVDELSNEWINKYIDSGEPMDKAGAYAIQGAFAIHIRKIDGCYYNVVGLPLNMLKSILENIG